MTSCVENTCGTGGWGGPKPGDPDNNIVVSAHPAYGGIDVIWSYPLTNPFAVAYATVFRSQLEDFTSAVEVAHDTDGFYFDRVEPEVTYYYWIQLVSINGTYGEVVGPASARAKSTIEKTLLDLTGKINEGLLSQTLQTSIDSITLNNQAIYKEIQDRLAGNLAFQDALAAVQSEVGEALTYILQETVAREDADGAIVTQVNAIAAGLDTAQAAIVEERTVRVTQNEASATTFLALTGRIEDAEGNIIEERNIRTTENEALVADYTALHARVGTTEGAITSESQLRINGDVALGTRIDQVVVNYGTAIAAAVQTETTARTNAVSAVASQVTTAESSLNGKITTVQTGLQTEINTVTGALDSMYFAKVQTNGLIGGFGIWNNGTAVQAGFDVDNFWIGRTNASKIKPFIVESDIVYINDAVIKKITFDKLRAADGSLVFENGKLKATYIDADNITAKRISISANGAGLNMTNTGITVTRSNGSTAIKIGLL